MPDITGNLMEDYFPNVKFQGIRSNKDMTFGDSATVTLPATTTIGGSSVVALGNITSSSTSATAFSVTNSGIFTGASVVAITANSATTGTVDLITANGLTTGHAEVITSSGVIVTSGDLFSVTGNSATTSTGLVRVSATGMTSGSTMLVTGGGANITFAGKVIEVAMGAATAGNGMCITSTGVYVTGSTGLLCIIGNSATTTTGLLQLSATGLTSGVGILVTGGTSMTAAGALINANLGAAVLGSGLDAITTGVYTDTTGLLSVTANSATTGTLGVINGLGLTSGIGFLVNATAATLTTGRYISVNDAATEVFGIGANGHIHSKVSAAPPTIAVTTQAGITAAAITAGGSDTCGVITTTGTSTGATILTITFGKTYTTAPKTVALMPANAAAAMPNTGYYISSITATTFVITVAAGGTYAATPSWYYQVIA